MRFGDPGSTFYIILQGEVGVSMPIVHEDTYRDPCQLFEFLLYNYHNILTPNDNFSKMLCQIVAFLTPALLLEMLRQGRPTLLAFLSECTESLEKAF
jgi:hypothetical protein